jgi:hypothetical protein
VSDECSYCGAVILEDDVPLRLFTLEGHAAVFCRQCEGAAFMALHLLKAEARGES